MSVSMAAYWGGPISVAHEVDVDVRTESMMCSYCGCEAKSVIRALMEDHARIAAPGARITDAPDCPHFALAEELVSELAGFLDHHGRQEEEADVLVRLSDAEVLDEMDRLVAEHRWLSGGLSRSDIVEHPAELRRVLVELHRRELSPQAWCTG